jgi:hypothetical protein
VENSEIDQTGHHAYGVNRLHVEQWVREHFPRVCTLRLPGLFGPGLKKNVIYDMMRDNELEKVHPDGNFQYYDTRLLASDIDKAWDLQITLINISSEPIKTQEIRDRFFPSKQLGGVGPAPASYDMKSIYDAAWGGAHGYLYGKEFVFDRLGDWLGSVKA